MRTAAAFEGQVVRVKGNYLLAGKGYNQPSPFPKLRFFHIHAIFTGTANNYGYYDAKFS